MRRKLVKHGAATLMVSVPRKWCKTNKLDKGDEVDIVESNNNLVISAQDGGIKNEATVNLISNSEQVIRTMIVYPYRLGYDRIRVNLKSEDQFKILQNTIKEYLLGFDVIQKKEDYCIIENITEPMANQFDNILQKSFMNIKEMFEITEQRLKNEKQTEDYRNVEQRIQQYDNFCRRIISKRQFEKNPAIFWDFLMRIMHGQRELYFLNKYLDKNKVKVSKEVLAFLNAILNNFEKIVESYSKKEISVLETIQEKEKDILEKKMRLIESNNGKEEVVIYHLSSCERNIYLSSSPLIGLLLS